MGVRLRHITDGCEKVSHWNHLKLIQDDVDLSFLKNENKGDSDHPAHLQVHDEAENPPHPPRCSLLSRC